MEKKQTRESQIRQISRSVDERFKLEVYSYLIAYGALLAGFGIALIPRFFDGKAAVPVSPVADDLPQMVKELIERAPWPSTIQISLLIFAAVLAITQFLKIYLKKIHETVFKIDDKMTKGYFGLDARDNIYKMMMDSFKRAVESEHEICVTSFVKHKPTNMTAAMNIYHDRTKPLIKSGRANVKRITTVEDIHKLKWVEDQIEDYTDFKKDKVLDIWARGQEQLDLNLNKAMIADSKSAEKTKTKTKMSLRILIPEMRHSSKWLMPINLELYGPGDAYVINPTMRGNEHPYDICSYFIENHDNYSIYRALFQNMWDVSEEVISVGEFKRNNYRRLKKQILRRFIQTLLFDAEGSMPRSDVHIQEELDRMDIDVGLLDTFLEESAASICGSWREVNLGDETDDFSFEIQWWNPARTSKTVELPLSSLEVTWVKPLQGNLKIDDKENQIRLLEGRAHLFSQHVPTKISPDEGPHILLLVKKTRSAS